jgi:uncharacterized membrane protein HdeD (DUF308 family)
MIGNQKRLFVFQVGSTMDKWFVILLGILIASLYVPPIVMPARHRELARRLSTKFMRRFGVVPMAIGIFAILVSNQSDLHHRMLLVLGVVEILLGIYLLTLPGLAVSQVQWLCSKSLKFWVARGVFKFTLGLGFILWGLFFF